GLLNHHRWFGINSITSRLKVMQLQRSDIIDIAYSANDAGITYNTLDILNEVFARQYQQLRFGETNDVIKFFEREVARLYKILTGAEDDLIRYNVSKRIINYGEQTRVIAGLDGGQQTSDNTQLMNYTTAKSSPMRWNMSAKGKKRSASRFTQARIASFAVSLNRLVMRLLNLTELSSLV
ncbi:MAG: hypothetical protein J6S87_01320, partial [Bacteroidales bacterium]|nr:hypothetical protein [Bacteroidales bacterium]